MRHIGRAPGRMAAGFLVALVALTGCQLPYTGGARPVNPTTLGTDWYRAASTQVVRQRQETDCGLAALAMVASAWGRHWSVAELNQKLPPNDRGTKLGALRDLAASRGLEAYAIQGSSTDLERELSHGRPVMLGLLLPYDRNHNASHYEVAVAIRPQDGAVVTIDPASGQFRQRTRQVLDLEWKPAGYATLVVISDRQQAAR